MAKVNNLEGLNNMTTGPFSSNAMTTPTTFDTSNITSMLDEIIARYQAGGSYEATAMNKYGRDKKKSLASQGQSLISAGLSNTTIPATLESKYEEEVGTGYKLGVEEQRLGALTQAMMAKSGFLERAATQQASLEEAQKNRNLSMLNSSRGSSGGGGSGGGSGEFNKIAAGRATPNLQSQAMGGSGDSGGGSGGYNLVGETTTTPQGTSSTRPTVPANLAAQGWTYTNVNGRWLLSPPGLANSFLANSQKSSGLKL